MGHSTVWHRDLEIENIKMLINALLHLIAEYIHSAIKSTFDRGLCAEGETADQGGLGMVVEAQTQFSGNSS